MPGICPDWDFRQTLFNACDREQHEVYAVLRLIPAHGVGCFVSFHNET